MINPKFYIITTGWKCEETIQRCKDSVANQTYKNYSHAIKTDPTMACVPSNVLKNGKTLNFNQCIRLIPDNNVIICDLDADDYLEPNALEVVAKAYEDDNIWLTYGSYKTMSGKEPMFCKEYKSDNFRLEKWKASHFKTFKIELYRKIRLRDLKDNCGFYFKICADIAMMFPMLEMAGLQHIKFISEQIYVYNDLSDYNDHKLNRQDQKKAEMIIRKKPKYNLITSLI